jgi:hypothetical protein
MIYLKSCNLLFLKPRKVAGTSFEIALSKFAGPEDILTPISPDDEADRRARGFRTAQNHLARWDELGPGDRVRAQAAGARPAKFYNHITAREARARLGPELFDAALKVSIVRDPFECLVSLYHWTVKHAPAAPDFDEWVRRNPAMINVNNAQYFIRGTPVIDRFLSYERIEADIAALEAEMPALAGLGEVFATIRAKGDVRPRDARVRSVFAGHEDLSATVAFMNAPIIERFGYARA